MKSDVAHLKKQIKIDAFDYFTSQIIKKYAETKKQAEDSCYSEFSKLKLLKLLFLAVMASRDITLRFEPRTITIFDLFDNFVAMPYGHVEIDIYSNLGESEHFNYLNDRVEPSFPDSTDRYFEGMKNSIIGNLVDKSIEQLLQKDKRILDYSAFKLVDISHKYESWKYFFGLAKSLGKQFMPIPVDALRVEILYFS